MTMAKKPWAILAKVAPENSPRGFERWRMSLEMDHALRE